MERRESLKSGDILLGSTFPLSLIRCAVRIEPRSVEELRGAVRGRRIHSFWGHANTAAAAGALLGVDVRPREERPALRLNTEGLPTLDGIVFAECWVLSPEYIPGYRPPIGGEVAADVIQGWQALRLLWETESVES